MIECPLCDANLDVEEDEIDEGDSIVCEECGANLKVASLNPLEIEEAEEELEEEDEDDEDDEEEDFDEEEEDDPWRSSKY